MFLYNQISPFFCILAFFQSFQFSLLYFLLEICLTNQPIAIVSNIVQKVFCVVPVNLGANQQKGVLSENLQILFEQVTLSKDLLRNGQNTIFHTVKIVLTCTSIVLDTIKLTHAIITPGLYICHPIYRDFLKKILSF